MEFAITEKTYQNDGNHGVVGLVDGPAVTVLDVGCGGGDNAAILRQRDPHKRIYGITGSRAEGRIAEQYLDDCWIADLEDELPKVLETMTFDCIILSHVLEHVRDPAELLSRLVPRLAPAGACVMAVPNVLYWRERWGFLRGRFEYQDSGILDATHVRFFTHRTAVPMLFSRSPQLRVEHLSVTGDVPLWILRRMVLPRQVSSKIDAWGCSVRPNLFGSQILVKARIGSERR